VVGGEWSKKAVDMAKPIAGDKLRVIATSEATSFDRSAHRVDRRSGAAYLHVCSNETVHGTAWPSGRSMANLIVDSSSEMMSRPHPSRGRRWSTPGRRRIWRIGERCWSSWRKDLYDRHPQEPVQDL